MGRRGRKSYSESAEGVVPFDIIAEKTGLTLAQVHYAFKKGMRKIKKIPNAFEAILATVHAVTEDSEHTYLRAGSVECNKEFIALFSNSKERS